MINIEARLKLKRLEFVAMKLNVAKSVQLLRGAVFALEDIGAQWKVDL